MKILIVNDDSISAPGIEVLARAAAKFGDVWVVAPATQCSAMSQRMTLRETLELRKCDDFPVEVKGAWSVSGSPVDCVKVALTNVMEEKPDLVLSGINNGYNVGFDTAYSGTLGAAFEAARNGLQAIALSTANDSHLAQLIHYTSGTVETDIELTLYKRCGTMLRKHHCTSSIDKQRIKSVRRYISTQSPR